MTISNQVLLNLIRKNEERTDLNIVALCKVLKKQELYIQSMLEYKKKFWFLPMAIYPGSYFFKKILRRKAHALGSN